MDPPSPILPPPPGSISPPRFLNEDFDIRHDDGEDDDEANVSLPTNLNASELLIEPPPPPMMGSSSLVEDSAGEEDDDDEDDQQQQTIIQNKLRAAQLQSGLDDMAAKLQSMISEEIEETIPKDPVEGSEQWSSASNPITSPPPPVWTNEVAEPIAVARAVAGGASVDDEEEDESSGNSQSPQQVHKILSPPPPPAVEDDEEEDEDNSRPEKW